MSVLQQIKQQEASASEALASAESEVLRVLEVSVKDYAGLFSDREALGALFSRTSSVEKKLGALLKQARTANQDLNEVFVGLKPQENPMLVQNESASSMPFIR